MADTTRYLWSEAGDRLGYLDESCRNLHSNDGNTILAIVDDDCRTLYVPDGGIYGFLSNRDRVTSKSGKLIGHFRPPI